MAETAAPFVQPQAYDADGKPIDPAQVGAAAAEGRAFFKQGARVYARNPSGALVTIAPEDVSRPGYTVLTPAQVEHAYNQKQYGEGLGNVAKAGAAGAARGLTLGASDALLAGIGGDDTRRALQGLREANPVTSTVSEVAGAIAPVALSGGAGAAAEAGALARAGQAGAGAVRTLGAGHRAIAGLGGLVERGAARGLAALGADGATAAGRVGAAAAKLGARGAAEGSLYGGAMAANDAVLNGDEITAEKIVAGMSHGALFGGAIGAGLGAVARGTSEVAAQLVPKKEALTQLAREQAGRAAGFKASDYKALVGRARGSAAEERIAATLDDLRNYEIKTGELAGQRVLQPGANAEEILERVRVAKSEAASVLSGLKDEISTAMETSGHRLDRAELLQRLEDNVFKPALKGATPSIRRRVDAARRELAALREVDELSELGLENTRYSRDGMRPESMTYARSAYEGASPAEARAIALGERPAAHGKALEPVRVDLFPGEAPVLNDGRHRMAAAKEAGADELMAVVTKYDDKGYTLSEELRPISISPRSPDPTFRDLDLMRSKLRETFQPPPVKGGGLPAPAPKNAAYLEGAEREIAAYLKEQAGTFLAKSGENPNAYNEANRLYHSFRQLDDVGTKATAHNLGNRMISPSDHAMGVAGFLGALTTGNVGAIGAMGAGAASTIANKLLRERGNSLVAEMARRAAEMDGSIDRVAQALAGKTERAKAPALAASFEGENLRETYERAAGRVRELAVPQAASAHIASLVPEVAAQYPLAGAAISTKLLQIYQQLAARLPQSHVDTGTTLTPLAIQERVPPAAMRKFLSQVSGALEPEKVISDLGRGVIDRDALEVLKAVHPRTFQQLRTKVADYVQENQEALPYKRRVMLSMVFDFNGDSSLEPARMAGLQQVAQSLSLQEQQTEAKMMQPQKSGARKTTLGKTLSTPSESALSGGV